MLVQHAKRSIGKSRDGVCLVVFCIALLGRASCAEASSLSAQDRTFLEDAALATLSQIQFAKIAIRKAMDPQVRAFASQNLSDYSRMQEALSRFATADQVQLPERLSGEALKDYRRLIVLPRPWFDRLYVYMMFKWHAVALRGYPRGHEKSHRTKVAGLGRTEPAAHSRSSWINQAHRDCKGRSDEFRRWAAHDSEVLNFYSPFFHFAKPYCLVRPQRYPNQLLSTL